MNKNFYKVSLLGLFFGTVYVANAQSIESKPPGVGVQTEDPQETLDVRGTVKVTDLPSDGANPASYNGQLTKNGTFSATKTVVANDQGVLGSLPYILPSGTTTNTTLKWNPTTNKWEAVPASVGEEPWKVMGTDNDASTNTQNIYQRASVGIGQFNTANYSPNAKLEIAEDVTANRQKLIGLYGSNNTSTDRAKFYIGNENAHFTISNEFGGLQRRFLISRKGNLHLGKITNPGEDENIVGSTFIYDITDQTLNLNVQNATNPAHYDPMVIKVTDKDSSDGDLSAKLSFQGQAGISDRFAFIGDNSGTDKLFEVKAEKDYTLKLGTNSARLVLDGLAGTQINHVSTGNEPSILVVANDGLVKKITGTSNGQVLKYDGTNWVAGADTDTNLANTNQTITSGEAREVNVNGSGTTLTFSSDRADDKNVIKVKKDNESLTIMPNTSEKATYIGFHKDQGADYTGYIGHGGAGDKDITIAANTTGSKVVLNGVGGTQIKNVNASNSADVMVIAADGLVGKRSIANLGGGEKSPWFVKNTNTPAKDTDKDNIIYHSGAVGIGFNQTESNAMENTVSALATADKKEAKLAVKGAVVAGAFRGAHGANVFPDYVFQKYYTGVSSIKDSYYFNTLSQVEDFIKENGHLPGYKSASQIKEEGYIDLMDTQITNVEKIEELYLHSIEQDKEIKAKDAKIKELEARLERLEKLLK